LLVRSLKRTHSGMFRGVKIALPSTRWWCPK
jgi:hypothetical protein